MFGITGIWVYFIIFFGKMIEVSFDTLRIVFIGKGKKFPGAFSGMVSLTIWVILINTILSNMTQDPWKVVFYVLAYAAGMIAGSTIEQWMAVGYTSMQIVLPEEAGDHMARLLREQDFGVTILDGHSVSGERKHVVLVQLRRKRIPEAVKLTSKFHPEAVVSVSDVRSLSGGYLR